MTTLYKPVLIETAEQAEALPEGTIATHPESLPIPIELSHDPDEGVSGYGIGTDLIWCEDLVGWTALVPIEAEEETTGALVNRVGEIHWEESRRLVTPWEAA